MLGATGDRHPASTWRVPAGFPERLEAVWGAIMERSSELAGAAPDRISRDNLIQAVRESMPDITPEEDEFTRRVSLAVIQSFKGSNVFFEDLEYLRVALLQGQVNPAEMYAQPSSLSHSLFVTQTNKGTKTLDILKTTGVNWKIPRGFLSRYNPVSHDILRRATGMVGARHDGAKDVVAGVWGRVDVGTFVEACRQVLGGLSPDEEEFIAALASEQVPSGNDYIRDLPYLDKCLQQGRTPTSIKGPVLLPTVFLNDTTSGKSDGLTLRHTGGRIF